MATTEYTLGQQVGHVQQDWVEIWGPDDAEGTHDVLGSAIGPDREGNAQLWAAAPELLETAKQAVPLLEQYAHMLDDAGQNQESAGIFIVADSLIAAIERYEDASN
jgi:hypothetical protein